jgi:hypothetical protein
MIVKLGHWSLENRVQVTFGPKGDELTGGWRKLHNDLHNVLFTKYN